MVGSDWVLGNVAAHGPLQNPAQVQVMVFLAGLVDSGLRGWMLLPAALERLLEVDILLGLEQLFLLHWFLHLHLAPQDVLVL